jgi:hypothetical protein
MAKSLLALLFVALYCTSYANAGLTVVTPGTGTLVNAGDYSTVTWVTNNDGPTEPQVDAYLYQGPPEDLKVVTTLCTGVQTTANGM